MKKFVLPFIAMAFVASSCNLLSPSIENTWHVTKIDPVARDKESESIYTGAFLSFYDDGVISFMNKNEHDKSLGQPIYRIGEWERSDQLLKVTLKKTTIDVTFQIVELSDKWLVLEIIEGPRETIGTQLKCQPSNLYRSKTFDLLDPVNNTWRIAPAHKESREEIKTRVSAHVRFLLNYFEMVNKKSQDYFETAILQTPLQFYSNGIALPQDFMIENKWLPYFYDEEDARVGAQMLSQAIGSIEDYPADDESYTKGYFNALLLMEEFIKK